MKPSLLFLAPSSAILGGVQQWLSGLVPDLRTFGHQVKVAVPDGIRHQFSAFTEAYPQLQCLPFCNPTGSIEGRCRSLERLLMEHNCDLVIGVNIGDLYPAVRRLRLKTKWPTPVAMSLHALECDYFCDMRMAKDLLAGVIATNRLSERLISPVSQIPPERVFYAPYGVALPHQTRPSRVSTDPSEPLRIAWVGRLEQPQKRVHDLTNILAALDRLGIPYRLSLAGDGPERVALASALRPWQERGCVRHWGRLSQQQLQDHFYPEQDVLLITSSWETGPIVAWEGMAAGLAVVTSDFLGRRLEGSLVHEQTCLVFACGDPEAAARQLARALDPGLRQSLARAGERRVREAYSREISSRTWSEAFEAIVALTPLPQPQPAEPVPQQGRLDRWFGSRRGETIRRALGLRYRHAEAGDEWPHAFHHHQLEPEELLMQAHLLETHA